MNDNSIIFIVNEHSGTVKWGLVKVDGGLIYPSSSVSATLEYGESIDLYFAATIAGIDTGSAYQIKHSVWCQMR